MWRVLTRGTTAPNYNYARGLSSSAAPPTGYQSIGSFHAENVDEMRALPASSFIPPLLPQGLLAIPRPASTHVASCNGEDDAVLRLDQVIAHAASCKLGQEIKTAHFLLDPDWTFVNHGRVDGLATQHSWHQRGRLL